MNIGYDVALYELDLVETPESVIASATTGCTSGSASVSAFSMTTA